MVKQYISKAVGIDLGTTNSEVAIMNPTDTDILIHQNLNSKSETTPSCVWKDPRTKAILVGPKAFSRAGTNPPPIRSIKRLMGQKNTVRLTDEDVTPEKVSSYILEEMKKQIEGDVTRFSNVDTVYIVDRAIVTIPAYFDLPRIEATRKAGEMAGLEVLELLHEPTASACYHCWKHNIQNGVFLVYDFGGGTFDVTVLRCTAGAFEVLAINGNIWLGGDNLDKALAEVLLQRLKNEGYALDLDLINSEEDRLRFDKLRFLAEGVKKALSSTGEYLLSDTASMQDKDGQAVAISTSFDRIELSPLSIRRFLFVLMP
jgi:molecular chaperone DnaK